ncbi:Hypothetical protein CpCap5W_0672 [Corynebacterium pseudotuberculosis]|nr:Hypothetical protein CpPAT10_1977a [Corynebacterium pseudotuberculosis PAT10]AEX40471.1 Hypothetical protein Cp3995_2027 [Corynebacterium pseudotuberculosis 3/99-5]AFF23114.1 Hypothetical protein CpP54B96_2002 [Corynebacterium pseudotuberculosis P54B96]AFH52916.1 Hypothetical protein Cp267_2045 [Corynebacterium pseudotuberculosis 267]AIG06197.1 hypothetical protein CPTA_00368 [Corynebacterium pseudotuberculosis]
MFDPNSEPQHIAHEMSVGYGTVITSLPFKKKVPRVRNHAS